MQGVSQFIKWCNLDGDKHDYMGFNTVDTGSCSSGYSTFFNDIDPLLQSLYIAEW